VYTAIKDVKKAILHGRRVIRDYGDGPVLHEATTRYAIIDPILRALGWKLENPKHCRFEEWRSLRDKQKVADYILLNRESKHAVLIEAKGFSITKLQGWTEEIQLKEYAEETDARIAVLTNGQSWYLYDAPWDDSFGVLRPPDADICDDTPSEAARTLHRFLKRPKLWKPDQGANNGDA
jgi:predicted type IV restriction endonuclease